MSSQVTGVGVSNDGEFGANEWLVEELYEQFKVDRNSVDKSWWPVLEAYTPADLTASAEAHKDAVETPSAAPAPTCL
uniref:2-oxoglutarate dehydrogenase E1 subunit family protein n=1 Tax=Microbacterium sp. 18062 TaxID=2681410 RepID=UPI001F2C3526